MAGETTSTSTSDATVLNPLPDPVPGGRGYLWAAGLVGVVLAGVLGLVAWGFFSVPGTDPVRAGGWYFAISLLIIVPAAVVVLVLSWGVIVLMRRMGARGWPGPVQATPAVALVLGLVFVLARFLLAGPEE
jgi:hypothetical protein